MRAMTSYDGEDSATAPPSPNAGPEQEIPAKRRKLRKGTRSCWECKRRKTKCIFVSSDEAACIGCEHRRVPCVTQELPEDVAQVNKGNRYLSDRLSRVEDFMKEYLTSKDDVGTVSRKTTYTAEVSDDQTTPTANGQSSRAPKASSSRAHGNPVREQNSPTLAADSADDLCPVYIETARRYLWAAFPTGHDAEILHRECSTPSLYTKLVNTQPHSKLTREALSAAQPARGLPTAHTHPVILAKYMLVFAITLQSPTGRRITGFSESQSALKHRLFAAATTWATTQPKMHGTLECLLCIILEGVFEINSGNLRRAWAVYRRAMAVAQLMGMHRSPMPRLKRIDTEIEADPDFVWFRIVYMDRYLSLLLGLPQGTSDTSIGAQSVLQNEPPLGRFERQLTAIASRILERNESPLITSGWSTTLAIDSDLLEVSTSMPADFWRPPSFHNLTIGSPEAS